MHSLKTYSTFRIDVEAKEIITIGSIEELSHLIESKLYKENMERIILGSGSNMLFTQEFNGLVINNNLKGKTIIKETDKIILLSVASGELVNDIVERSNNNGYYGIENLISIPGTIGAAPVQNIGAYGVEIRDIVVEVEGIDLTTGKKKTYTNEQCEFGYRTSIFKSELKNSFFITNIILQLTKVDKNYNPKIHYGDVEIMLMVQGRDGIELLHPLQVSEAIAEIRASKLPDRKKIGTAGSFFQNPIISSQEYKILQQQFPDIKGNVVAQDKIKLSAAKLIESVDLKGYRNGDAGIYNHHALVLINYGNATGQEMKDLIKLVQDKVQDKFGMILEPEVNIY